jgi:ribosomal protein S18 acetylase RimI-like enzyme
MTESTEGNAVVDSLIDVGGYRLHFRVFPGTGPTVLLEAGGGADSNYWESLPADLHIVVEAPNGQFVSYSGTWFEPTNCYAYVEPVATDPDYRLRGLGRAAVLEGIRHCGALGATVAYVGSDLAFYRAIGFAKIHSSQCWTKYLE